MIDGSDEVRFAEQPGGMTARQGWTWDESDETAQTGDERREEE